MGLSHVLLDLDGTLTDPKVGITSCIDYALIKLGVPSEQASLDWCIGPPLIESFELLLNTREQQVLAQAISFYRERFSGIGLYENTLYPDVLDGLLKLKRHNFSIYLATSKPHVFAHRILDHFKLSQFFDAVYGSELSGERNDKTELIAYLLKQEKFDPLTAVMVGDRKHDVIGAKNNGIRSIAVSYGYGSAEELRLIEPDQQCGSFAEVVKTILND